MKKTLYIHIGRPKVASTAIQHFLWLNKTELLEQGCFYPFTGHQHRASHGLALTLQPNGGGVEKFKNIEPKLLYQELIQEINDQATADRVILSSENFYFVDPKKVARLLDGKFDVKIICFVRSQADVIISSYIQELKEDSLKDDSIENFIRDPARLKLIDYYLTLTKWASTFGRENIIVRPYEQEQFEGGDVFRDILHVMKLDVSEDFHIPSHNVNPSPPSDVLAFIKLLNTMSDSNFIVKQLTRSLLDATGFLPKEARYDIKSMLSTAQRHEITRRFSDSNEKVAREFLGRNDGILFYQKDRHEEGIATTKEFTIDRFVTVAAKLFLNQQEHITRMQMRLDNQRDRIDVLSNLLSQDSDVAAEVLAHLESKGVQTSDDSPDETTNRFGSKFKRWFS